MISIDVSQDDIFSAIGDYLLATVPSLGRGQIVKTPVGNDPLPFGAIVMNIIDSKNMDTTRTRYDEQGAIATVQRSVMLRLQLDFYGTQAGDRSSIIETLWRSEFTVDTLGTLTPLYVNSLIRDMYINDSEVYEDRWLLDLVAQYNPMVTHEQDFVTEIDLTIKPVI